MNDFLLLSVREFPDLAELCPALLLIAVGSVQLDAVDDKTRGLWRELAEPIASLGQLLWVSHLVVNAVVGHAVAAAAGVEDVDDWKRLHGIETRPGQWIEGCPSDHYAVRPDRLWRVLVPCLDLY